MAALFSTAYLPPISYVAALLQNSGGKIEAHENFVKQSYRNRCRILGPNGVQNLTVPVLHKGGKINIKNVQISYAENWPALHWRSILAAYQGRAFFNILADDLHAVIHKKHTFLFELNREILTLILDWLQSEISLSETGSFISPNEIDTDFRFKIHPKAESILSQPLPYYQHFSPTGKFEADLSVIDLIFSEGRASWDYLNDAILG